MQLFNVLGHNQSGVVELKKNGWKCSFNSKSFCSHIIAVHLSIGLKQECGKMPNAENLRHNNKPKKTEKAGRKQPRSIDIPEKLRRTLADFGDVEEGIAGLLNSDGDLPEAEEKQQENVMFIQQYIVIIVN